MHFFPWPLKLDHDIENHGGGIYEHAHMIPILLCGLELCNDPRARECESGAVIIRILFER